jgi:gamma-glutamylcyclotransferase (GGCT)/AIG2-like uncharacterized protein YtfP
MKLFVYGTLMRSHRNNLLLTNSKFLGNALTEVGYELAVSGIPYLIKGGEQVVGEVYEVADDDLEFIDMLEGHPNCYTRENINVILDGEPVTAQAYHWKHLDKNDYPKIKDYNAYTGRR